MSCLRRVSRTSKWGRELSGRGANHSWWEVEWMMTKRRKNLTVNGCVKEGRCAQGCKAK